MLVRVVICLSDLMNSVDDLAQELVGLSEQEWCKYGAKVHFN